MLRTSSKEPACVPNSHIVLQASIGDFLDAKTAKLEITIETTAAATGAAIARRTCDVDGFFIMHQSSQSQVARELSFAD